MGEASGSDLVADYMVSMAALNRGDLDGFVALFADEVTWDGEAISRDALRESFKALTGYRCESLTVTAHGRFLVHLANNALANGDSWTSVAVVQFGIDGRIARVNVVRAT
jgi:hypothetical protein